MPVVVEAPVETPLKMPVLTLLDADDESSCGNQSEGATLSDSDPKDSGVDSGCSEQAIHPYISPDVPDDETAGMIMRTVEFYLSDENILKDPFLLKHVRRNKEGFVSLKLLASFRRVRSLSRNWKAVSHSVQKSQKLALNEDGTKVRRLAPLPDHDETVHSRSVIVHGLSGDNPSVEVSGLFAQCGDIALVRVIRPGGQVPTDVKKFLSKNPDLQAKLCALVEFDDHASAKKALEASHPEGIVVVPIVCKNSVPGTPPDTPKKKKKNRKASNGDVKKIADADPTRNGDFLDDQTKRNRRSGSVSSTSSSGYLSSSPSPSGNPFDSRYPRRHSYNPAIYSDPNSSFASLSSRYQGSKERLQKEDSSSSLCPWRRRREQQMQSDSNLLSSVATSNAGNTPSQLIKAIRAPKGPDGTNGFVQRCRPRLPSTAE